jgi:OOP family OmpA-OmpF porin
MTDSSDQDSGGSSPYSADVPPHNGDGLTAGDFSKETDSLKRLRRLILGPYQDQLAQLQNRLDTPERHASDVSKILPEAIAMRSARDRKIELALEPITAKTIRASIQKDRKILVDALFPVMGPAIRKAIASTLQGMIQSFNQILEHSLSLKGFKWRFEALRTRKPFAEVVLLHTLVYQVEQVFLIHKDSGLVLQHVAGRSIAAQDPDLVSGMLSAIKDFVQDSFGGTQEDNLETLRIGERNVWIEQGDQAILAAVIRGNPPVDMQLTLRDAIEAIHFKQRDALVDFDGDTTAFEETRYILVNCLQAQFMEQKKKRSFFLWFIVGLIVFFLGFWIYRHYDDQRRWSRYLNQLRLEPGVVITGYEKQSGKHYITGLRDPLARDPAKMLLETELGTENVIFEWEPYFSTYPDYAKRRIRDILKPPDSVTLGFHDGILSASGSALHAWLAEARRIVMVLPWIQEFQFAGLVDIDTTLDPPATVNLEISGSTLVASGSASHGWIRQARESAGELPGISRYKDHNIVDTDLVALKDIKERLEKQNIFFKAALSELAPGQESSILDIISDIHRLAAVSRILGKRTYIELIGHSDSLGTADRNIALSLQRARALQTIFLSKGVAVDMTVHGVGSRTPLKEASSSQDRHYNRRVTLKVNFYN